MAFRYMHQSKPNEKCAYCVNHSTPISIIGDSFNLDEPVINPRNISASKYISKSLKNFVKSLSLTTSPERLLRFHTARIRLQEKNTIFT